MRKNELSSGMEDEIRITAVFGERFRELRMAAGLNQAEVGEKLGVSKGAISFYENGDRKPSIGFIFRTAEFFQVSSDWLLGRAGAIKSFRVLEDGDYRGLYLVEKEMREELEKTCGLLVDSIKAIADNGYEIAQAYLGKGGI